MSELMLERGTEHRGLAEIEVSEAMHPGVLTCPLETSLRDVARMMSLYRIHAVVAYGEDNDDVDGPGLWGVVSDLDLVQATVGGERRDDRGRGHAAARRAADERARGDASRRRRPRLEAAGRRALDTRHRAGSRRVRAAAL